MTRLFGVMLVAAAWAGGGCSSSPAASVDAGNGADQFIDCSSDTRAMPYQSGMQVMSNAGALTLTLESVPGPPVKGTNTWTIQVKETATGAPLDGLDIGVVPWMVDHDHGTKVVVVTPAGSGTYTLQPVHLYMSGTWDVRFTIVGAVGGTAPAAENASIWICIP